MLLIILGISLLTLLCLNKKFFSPFSITHFRRNTTTIAASIAVLAIGATSGLAQPAEGGAHKGGEAELILPDLSRVSFLGGVNGHSLLLIGFLVSLLGVVFGFIIYTQLKKLPVHQSMRELSELIYETCKTYLITQGRFLLILEAFIAAIILLYFGLLRGFPAQKVIIILLFSLVGILGSYGVAWFGIRVNTYANSRTAFASLEGRPYPV